MGPLATAPGHLPLSTLAPVHLPMTAPPISATPQSLPFGITCFCLHMGRHGKAGNDKRLSSCYVATTAFRLRCGEHTVSTYKDLCMALHPRILLHVLLLTSCEGKLGHKQLVLYCYRPGAKSLMPACPGAYYSSCHVCT